MRGYRKLGRTGAGRKALLRNQTTELLYHGSIITTEARAKEVRRMAERLIALGVREKDNYEEVVVRAKVPRKDAQGRRIKETREIDGRTRRVTVYDEVDKTIRRDLPSRLKARRQILSVLYDVTEVPRGLAGRKAGTHKAALADKVLDEYGARYATRNGGYTRIVRIGERKGDAAMMVLLELV